MKRSRVKRFVDWQKTAAPPLMTGVHEIRIVPADAMPDQTGRLFA
jgi:hypothetical protein